MLPYIISEDLEILMRRWGKKTSVPIPDHQFFESLQTELILGMSGFFPDAKITYIDYASLSEQLAKRISAIADTTIVVSIDHVYNGAIFHLESNRIADRDTMKVLGEAERPGFPSITDQISALPYGRPITLVDDGCFSGATLKQIVKKFHACGKKIGRVIVGISINPKANVFVEAFPEIPLEAVYVYDQVKDWVCERDFYLGVPLSGRTAGMQEDGVIRCILPEVALAYCYPFGDPIEGASVPVKFVGIFSEQMIRQSLRLWSEIGRIRGKPILCSEVPRLPRGIIPEDQTFVDAVLSQTSAYCQAKAEKCSLK